MATQSLVFLDLDGTLYPDNNSALKVMTSNFTRFITDRLKVTPEEAAAIETKYYMNLGLTPAGLWMDHGIPLEEAYDFVLHQHLDVREHLEPSPTLVSWLQHARQNLAVTFFVLTNADARHARKSLDALGITEELFPSSHIIDVHAMYKDNDNKEQQPQTMSPSERVADKHKPNAGAYHRALAIAERVTGQKEWKQIWMFEDSPKNLVVPKQLGWRTVWVHTDGERPVPEKYKDAIEHRVTKTVDLNLESQL
eukprot:PhM_4_TR3165/c0_g1_i1/m.62714/K07025/K07025; putative hydrolase of the HAD superfamily